jgi:hypothetical protein
VPSDDTAPKTCANGHGLGPRRVLVSFALCACDHAGPGGGHLTWTCRECGDVRYSDGHTDDAKLLRPSNPRLG